jgi:predicted TIM-barrel fold metal-dependent hydrolase
VLFFAYAMFAAVDWLYSRIPVRFPGIKICMSEGGIAWVPGLLDRLDHVGRYQELYGTWEGIEPTPAEVLKRNFWFCAIEDPTTFRVADRIGEDNLLVESDYPHLDSTWPDTQAVVADQLAGLHPDAVRKISWENASRLFRHPVPVAVQDDHDAY